MLLSSNFFTTEFIPISFCFNTFYSLHIYLLAGLSPTKITTNVGIILFYFLSLLSLTLNFSLNSDAIIFPFIVFILIFFFL